MIGSIEQSLAEAGDRSKPSSQSSADDTTGVATAAPMVLIIEDDFFVASHIEAVLNDLGYTNCAIASQPVVAVNLATDLQPDLLLADVNLGTDIDGIETAQLICSRQRAGVVFVTAYTDAATMNRIRRAFPAAPILNKPVSSEQLKAALDQAAAGSAS